MISGMKLRLVLAGLMIFLGAWRSVFAQGTGEPQTLPEMTLHIDKATLQAEIAATPEEQEIGLMYVTKMPDNEGMIFLLPKVEQATFWMKNTLIPLSIAFIDSRGVILDIHDMKALDETTVRSTSDQVAYALETNLHWFALNGIKAGDKIEPPGGTWPKPQP
jgi:uncharacterized membrane protein (UPF0127 family)